MHDSRNKSGNYSQRRPNAGLPLIISLSLHMITILLLIGIWGDIRKKPHLSESPPIEVALIEVEELTTPENEPQPLEKKTAPLQEIDRKHHLDEMKPSSEKLEKLSPHPKKTILAKPNPTTSPLPTQPPSPNTGLINDSSYALEVARHISKYKFYPLAARQRHVTGKLLASITLDGQGKLIAHKIEQSSGSHILDHAALKALAHASPYPPPQGGGQTTLKIPLNYTLLE